MERVGISPKVAEPLARHRNEWLTFGVYTHISLHDQTATFAALPTHPNLDQELKRQIPAKRAAGPEGAIIQ
ncbi:MAG: hypothetical protein ACKOFW_01590, partial [Planctomycetaceae bacterium]